jgi:hypothetical protein
MLKKIILALLLMAFGNYFCNAQQYFTGTVRYKFSLPPEIERDTQRILVEYATNYIKIIPLQPGKSAERSDIEAVVDWVENCLYQVNHNEKRVLKSHIKRSELKITLQKEFSDSVCNLARVNGRLQKYIIAKDNIPVDCWLADSILLPQRDFLQTNSDFFFFGRERLMLKMEIKHISDTLEAASMFSEITVIAENITPVPANDLRYQLPAGYKIIDEAEQQRISDSIMRAFKTVDSSLLLSEKDLKTKLDSAIRQVKGLDGEFADSQQKVKKTLPGKRKLKHIKKQAARKP